MLALVAWTLIVLAPVRPPADVPDWQIERDVKPGYRFNVFFEFVVDRVEDDWVYFHKVENPPNWGVADGAATMERFVALVKFGRQQQRQQWLSPRQNAP